MRSPNLIASITLSVITYFAAVSNLKSIAQSIVPAADSTGTTVNVTGSHFTIDGGSLSGDGTNLFHSFEKFGLTSGQVAEFLSNPQIQNILSRIVGGDPSIINGLIAVTGGNSNLYLLNPAGIVFGAGASLNVPGDFTATTATGMGFGDGNWFNVFGSNHYTDLNGEPAQFAFDLEQSGTIINAGHLTLNSKQNLTLLGGAIINIGTLATEGGNILVSAVPGSSTIRISQPGKLLSLEINPPRDSQGNLLPFNAIDLPALLTGTDVRLTANGNETVEFNDSETIVPFAAETVLSTGIIDSSGTTGQGGTVHFLGEQVALLDDARIDVSGETGGGIVRIGGDYLGQHSLASVLVSIPLRLSPTRGLTAFADAGSDRYLGGGNIPNARFNFGGENVSIHADARSTGDGGTVIVWADEATRFYGNISARGGQNGGDGGFIETSGKDYLDVFGVSVDASAVSGNPGEWLLDPRNVTITNVTGGGSFTLIGNPRIFTPTSDDATINVADITGILGMGISVRITTGSTGNQDGDITVATAINPAGVGGTPTLTLDAANDIIINAPIVNGDPVLGHKLNLALSAVGDIDVNSDLITAGGRINLIGGGNIDTTGGTLDTSEFRDGIALGMAANLAPGDVTLNAVGSIITGAIDTSATQTNAFNNSTVEAGNVTLTAGSTIAANGAIDASANISGGNTYTATGGNVTLTSGTTPGSSISFVTIDTTALSNNGGNTANGGNTTLTAYGLVRGSGTLTGGNTIDTSGNNSSGTISITHDGGFDNIDFTVGGSTANGTAGGLKATSQLASGSFPVLANGGLASGTPSDISITSINSPPTISAFSTTVLSAGDNLTLSYADLAAVAADTDLDNLTFTLNNLTNLGTLTLNGTTVTGSSVTVSSGDVLIYTPPTDFSGTINVFDVSASDVVSNSNEETVTVTVLTTTSTTGIICLPIFCDDLEPLDLASEIEGDRAGTPWLLAAYCQGDKRRSIHAIESLYSEEYARYLDLDAPEPLNLQQVQATLKNAQSKTGITPGAIYLAFCPRSLASPLAYEIQGEKIGEKERDRNTESNPISETTIQESYPPLMRRDRFLRDDDRLVLVLVPPEGEPIRRAIDATRGDVREIALEFRTTVTNVRRPNAYLKSSKQMYEWLLAPLEEELVELGIQHLTYIPDTGIRIVPLAAMHDGKGFIIERYSVSLMPNISASDSTPNPLNDEKVLAMGADRFAEQPPLPAVPLELELIAEELWQGDKFLNEQFTLKTLDTARQNAPYGIIHLATHSDFRPGNLSESYIQLWDSRLSLDRLRNLRWNFPSVEMLVLSACRTALGDADAELGFAGLAVAAGVKSALGSLWYVNDEGTLGLMTQFYAQLQEVPIRAEALRQAQLKMLRQEVRFEAGNLIGVGERVTLPPELARIGDRVLSHPYYWSAFTMVGNPF